MSAETNAETGNRCPRKCLGASGVRIGQLLRIFVSYKCFIINPQ